MPSNSVKHFCDNRKKSGNNYCMSNISHQGYWCSVLCSSPSQMQLELFEACDLQSGGMIMFSESSTLDTCEVWLVNPRLCACEHLSV